MFQLGSVVLIEDAKWKVLKYHKVAGEWEVLFQSLSTGVKKSISCKELETYV